MIAFTSYSIGETEQYILPLLAMKLREKGFTLTANFSQAIYPDTQALNEIRYANLFIGLITKSGPAFKTKRVYQEFQQAINQQKPSILLIENTVSVAPSIRDYPNTVRFDRRFLDPAIEEVKNKIKASQNSGIQQNDNNAAWILGGVAALGLLAWLASDEK